MRLHPVHQFTRWYSAAMKRKTLIKKCYETTKITPEDEYNSLPDKNLLAKNIKDLNLYDDDHIKNDEKIEYLKEVEEVALEKKEIINTESGFSESKSNFILAANDPILFGLSISCRWHVLVNS